MTNLTAKKATFIDRDGTLVEEVNFLSKPEDLRIYAFTRDALTRLKHHGFLVIVLTNQSGIGRSIYSESDMHVIHDQMNVELPGLIDAFYFCPHLPEEGCVCRKPNLGMIEAAQRDFAIDLSGSWIIGDKQLDVETGFNAGISTALVQTGYGSDHQHRLERRPDVIVENLGSAVDEIIRLMTEVTPPVETVP